MVCVFVKLIDGVYIIYISGMMGLLKGVLREVGGYVVGLYLMILYFFGVYGFGDVVSILCF